MQNLDGITCPSLLGEPNDKGDEKCAEFWRSYNFLWNDRDCGVKGAFICETLYKVIC